MAEVSENQVNIRDLRGTGSPDANSIDRKCPTIEVEKKKS